MGIFNNNLKRKSRRWNRSKGNSRFLRDYLRLVVFRSNKHFESQIVNDFEGQTIASCSSRDKVIKKLIDKSKNKTDLSVIVGKNLAKLAKKKKISRVVFDRNGYPFHGRVKAFADAAREEGLKF